ncbi:MAG: metallophosphoesterase [Deltaproteobacteria bacterium]|nr:metallophosphoesterase [Deltaproteobacteria bacterium]MBW2218791.1 metallophosphoesterase [Deltaproteobacteria bacterium]
MTYRIRQIISFAGFLALFFILVGCWLDDDNSDEIRSFKIVVVSDIHVRIPGNPDDDFYNNQVNLDNIQHAIDLINEYYSDADFVTVTGDLVGCLFSEDPDDYLTGSENPAEKFKQMFDGLVPPYHVAFGNHDYYVGFDPDIDEHIITSNIDAVESVWKKVLGTDPYYSFVHKGIQMIFLNSNRGSTRFETCQGFEIEALCKGSFDPEQMAWLESCLKRSEPAIIFCHHPPGKDSDTVTSPLLNSYSIDPDDRFYEIAENYKDKILAIFAGHWHLWQEYTLFDSIAVYVTGAVGDPLGSSMNIYIVEIDTGPRSVQVERHHSANIRESILKLW